MSSNNIELKVEMMCDGCVGAVKRILTKIEGVHDVDIVLESKKVTVVGTCDAHLLIEKLNKAGKQTSLWSS
jgi:copper chaperone